MPVLYVNLKEQNSLKKEPYTSFFKKFDLIREDLSGEQIELRVEGRDGSFANGFYIDKVYYRNPRLSLRFAVIPTPEDPSSKSVFIRAAYSYEADNHYDFDFHMQRVKAIKKRAPYFFIPHATHFEFSSQVDDEYRLFFDALVDSSEMVEEVCCSLISMIITVFSLDD